MSDQSILSSSNSSSNLSALEKELKRSTSNNDANSLKDEIYQALIEDQKEQLLFLKEEIIFLRQECTDKGKYITHLQDNLEIIKKNYEKKQNLPNGDLNNEDSNHQFNPFNPFNETIRTWVSSEG